MILVRPTMSFRTISILGISRLLRSKVMKSGLGVSRAYISVELRHIPFVHR